jgi:hypothetical protein
MADTDNAPRTTRRAIVTAAPRPCAQCPWRTRNQTRRDRHGFYKLENLRRLWDGLRDGERMTCHPTDPEMAEFDGYEATAGRERTRECAGALVLIQRELVRFQTATTTARRGDALARYSSVVGEHAMTREGIAAHLFTMLAGRTPLCGGVEVRNVDLNEPDIAMPDLPAWGECPLDPPGARR